MQNRVLPNPKTSKCTPLGVFGSFECRISNKEEDSELEMRAAEEF